MSQTDFHSVSESSNSSHRGHKRFIAPHLKISDSMNAVSILFPAS